MNDQLMVPDKIRVGFQKRPDTYDGVLGFITWLDHQNNLKQAKSWEQWRDKKITSQDFDNVPIEGFVLNKKVGGNRGGWNFRDSYVRVYDPRGFEFEISVPNLLFILTHCNSSKGKGLEGKFVYSWHRSRLVLLPVNSQEYENSQKFTKLQSQGVKKEDLIPGASYQTKKEDVYVYLGRFKKYNVGGEPRLTYVFWTDNDFVFLNDIKSIACCHSEGIAANYADLIDKYRNSIWGSKPVKLFLDKNENENEKKSKTDFIWAYQDENNKFFLYSSVSSYNYEKRIWERSDNEIHLRTEVIIEGGKLIFDILNKVAFRDPKVHRYNPFNAPVDMCEYIVPTDLDLWIELESGFKFPIKDYRHGQVRQKSS